MILYRGHNNMLCANIDSRITASCGCQLKIRGKQTLLLRLTQRILEYDDWNVSSYWKRIVLV